MRRAALSALAATLALSAHARAEPQWNAGAVTGVCGRGAPGEVWQDTCWFNGVRVDVLFGRERYADTSAGPYLALTTAGFEDLRVGGGGTFLWPVTDYFPLGLSAGGYAREAEGWRPGVSASVFFGSRSYNFHGSYVMAGGLLVGVDQDLREPGEHAVIVAAQIDGLILALPFLMTYAWLRGNPDPER